MPAFDYSRKAEYKDVSMLLGLTPVPDPPPPLIAVGLDREVVILVSRSKNFERPYFRRAHADIFKEDMIDFAFDVGRYDPAHRCDIALYKIAAKHHSKFRNDVHHQVYREVEDRSMVVPSSKKSKAKPAKRTFYGGHDGSNDAFWTHVSFFGGVFQVAKKARPELQVTQTPPCVFPSCWRVVSVDFEGGPEQSGIPRQIGITMLCSSDVVGLAFDQWINRSVVRSLVPASVKDYRNPFCLPHREALFCRHEVLEDGDFTAEIWRTFQRQHIASRPPATIHDLQSHVATIMES
ncbi:hypothetical protein EJ04DRAFT_23012 [Polyplosphaeria fusca]|uniref:Uncharacterized protein n=1 Tax=Polyplosphaeria fusca TaxID=682080 RepID=A0A9P4R7X2_9PLEO|nr:hypothetical protein EJ04DRAFT_23012 [Polyplosphaeria fusca]